MKLLIAPLASNCPGPVGRMIAQAGRLGLMNSHGSGIIRLACSVSGWPVVRSAEVTVELLIGSKSVNGVALPALSCQVWKCMISDPLMLRRILGTSRLVTFC